MNDKDFKFPVKSTVMVQVRFSMKNEPMIKIHEKSIPYILLKELFSILHNRQVVTKVSVEKPVRKISLEKLGSRTRIIIYTMRGLYPHGSFEKDVDVTIATLNLRLVLDYIEDCLEEDEDEKEN